MNPFKAQWTLICFGGGIWFSIADWSIAPLIGGWILWILTAWILDN